jgi:hypothetical protein
VVGWPAVAVALFVTHYQIVVDEVVDVEHDAANALIMGGNARYVACGAQRSDSLGVDPSDVKVAAIWIVEAWGRDVKEESCNKGCFH